MGNTNEPTFGHGKICYIEIPTTDIDKSIAFYQKTFNWQVRTRDDGTITFDDGFGVSGAWVTGQLPATTIGILISIMVDDAVTTLDSIVANGGEIIEPIGKYLPEITARFTDPSGNIFGIYQHRG